MYMEGRIITETATILKLALDARRVAVLGIAPDYKADRAAFYVPQYMKKSGVKVVPVPVYYPNVTEILGEKVYRKLRDVPESETIDILNVFRKPADIPQHMDDIIAAKPKAVWFQLGISNEECAAQLAAAGIDVVQNRCLMVDHREASASSSRKSSL